MTRELEELTLTFTKHSLSNSILFMINSIGITVKISSLHSNLLTVLNTPLRVFMLKFFSNYREQTRS